MHHQRLCIIPLLWLVSLGCSGGYTALEPGNAMPELQAVGWTNGDRPHSDDLAGKVLVLEVFATW